MWMWQSSLLRLDGSSLKGGRSRFREKRADRTRRWSFCGGSHVACAFFGDTMHAETNFRWLWGRDFIIQDNSQKRKIINISSATEGSHRRRAPRAPAPRHAVVHKYLLRSSKIIFYAVVKNSLLLRLYDGGRALWAGRASEMFHARQ